MLGIGPDFVRMWLGIIILLCRFQLTYELKLDCAVQGRAAVKWQGCPGLPERTGGHL